MKKELQLLKEQMKKNNINCYIIPTDDFHLSEYVADYFKSREYVSGFTGSSGTLVVTDDFAGLWTDSRYFLQAENQLKESGITLQKYLYTQQSSYLYYIKHNLPQKSVIGFDARCVCSDKALQIKKIADSLNGNIVDIDLVNDIWENRPAMPSEKVFVLDEKITGESTNSKIEYMRKILNEKNCDCHIIASLDEIAYITNMRGSDIQYNPVFLSYMIISNEDSTIYIDDSKLDDKAKKHLNSCNIDIKAYNKIYQDIEKFNSKNVMVDTNNINYKLYSNIPSSCNILNVDNPFILKKAIKNNTELENIIYYHKVDAVAMIRWIHWLKTNVGKIEITEMSCDKKMQYFRSQGKDYRGLSFNTIAGFMEHGAIVHYSASESTDKKLENKSMLLFDSGAQYIGGTTDITRTIALGEVTDDMRRDFTLVLKGHLALANARFHYGVTGTHLDILAKKPLWENGMTYGHGTGHGVGCYLCVHEGPQKISQSISTVPLEHGMVISNEPGLYKAGKYGIRIENLVYCKEDYKNEMGTFMKFVDLTLVPIDLSLVDKSIMTKDEIAMLNNYHKRVYDEISPMIEDEEVLNFLKDATRMI